MITWTEKDVVDAFQSVMEEPVTPAGSTMVSTSNPDALSQLLQVAQQIDVMTGTITGK